MFTSLSSEVDVQYNTYQITSETAIIYRTKERDFLNLLVPNNTAQALHIVPFPSEARDDDAAKMDEILREQIYNSYWNGFLLGYPVRFVESYLRSFHTNLSQEGIAQEMHRAQRDVQRYFDSHKQLRRKEIGYGNDLDLLKDDDVLTFVVQKLIR